MRDKADMPHGMMPEDDEMDIDAQMAQTAPPPKDRCSSKTISFALAHFVLGDHLGGTLIALPCPTL